MIKLYHSPSSRSLRVLWLLEELNLEYQLEIFKFRKILLGRHKTPEFLKKHPLGLIPVLEMEEQSLTLFESAAICSWLSDRYPDKKLSPPLDDPLRPYWLQWLFFGTTTLEPHAFTLVRHTKILPKKYRSQHRIDGARKQLHECIKVLESVLNQQDFIVKSGFSSADIILATTLDWNFDELNAYPATLNYVQTLKNRSSYIKANQIK